MDFNDLLNLMIQQSASDLFVTADVEPSMKNQRSNCACF
jgi:twitching motility protein PilU